MLWAKGDKMSNKIMSIIIELEMLDGKLKKYGKQVCSDYNCIINKCDYGKEMGVEILHTSLECCLKQCPKLRSVSDK